MKLPVKELAKKIICDGHLFVSFGTKKFYVMKPGVFVDQNFIKKYAAADTNFDFDCVSNPEILDRFRNYFRELRYLQFEKDIREKCFEIINYFHEVYSNQEHFLSFALACHAEFCQLPLEVQSRMHETDIHLYRKALYSSAFAVIVAMTNDFYHFPMLKDLYNLTFSLDIGLCETSYSYFVAEACNHENKMPGDGKRYLESEKASTLEREVYLKHPERGYNFIKQSNILAFPELAEVTLYQHELTDGSGFPRGVMKGQVSSAEAVVIFADSLVEIVAEYSFENDVLNYLLGFKNQKLQELPVGRVFKKLCMAFDHFKSLKETGS